MRRFGASLLIAAVTLLALEGALSLLDQPSVLRRLSLVWSDDPLAASMLARPLSDEERRRAAAENPGIWRTHVDPRVGYVLRSDSHLTVRDGKVHSDELGLRRRAGPPEPPDALRVAIMGASIPFGFGVDDDETLAHRLELELAAARGDGERPVTCRTVAVGRWNVRNATSFLHDHMAELRPDLVLFMPYDNDLSDSDSVGETGHRRAVPDPAQADPWLSVRTEEVALLTHRVVTLGRDGAAVAGLRELGADALTADLSPESSRRYDDNAALLLRLRAELAARGADFVYVLFRENPHAWHTLRRMQAVAPELRVLPLLADVLPEFNLPDDGHPNATTYEVFGAWIARDLLECGLLPRGAGPLPGPQRPEYEARRARRRTPADIAALDQAVRGYAVAELQPVVDFATGRGVRQIYGGVAPGGTTGPRLALLLGRRGSELDIELAPLEDSPGLYPLAVTVHADGARLGVVTLGPGGPVRARFPLPPGDAPALEVRLSAPDWVVGRYSDFNVLETAAYRPVRIACDAD